MTYPDREKVKLAYDLREENPELSARAIAAMIGVSKNTAAKWFNHPETFDPYIDEVAVERAFAGELPVYDNLTLFERQAVLAKLSAELDEFRQLSPLEQQVAPCFVRFGAAEERVYKAVIHWETPAPERARKVYVQRDRTKRRTPEVVARVQALRDEGLIYRDIAARLGISYDTARRAGNAA